MINVKWTKSEKKAARNAFELALQREHTALVDEVRQRSATVKTVDDVWQMQRFITERIRHIEETYDYRYSVLLFVFADLVARGRLSIHELRALSDQKREVIASMADGRDM